MHDELVYADELGFDGMVLNEHHQNIYGLMPSPNIIAAALKQKESPMSTDKATPPWRLATLLHAPHRLSFFMAAVVMATSALWWWLDITARAGLGPALPSVVAPALLHPVVMALGFMPLFFCGFLFTAGPKWLQMPEVTARAIAPAVLTLGLGWMMVLGGSFVHALASALGALLAATYLDWSVVYAIMAALVFRTVSGQGQYIDVAQCETGMMKGNVEVQRRNYYRNYYGYINRTLI